MRTLLVLAVLALGSFARAAVYTELDLALGAFAARTPANIERLKAVPVEFAAVAAVLPYGDEALPPLAPNPTKEQLAARLDAKEAYWRRVSGLIQIEWGKRRDAARAASDALSAVEKSGDLLAIADAARDQMRADKACSAMAAKDDAVRYILADIREDRKLINGRARSSERLAAKQNLLDSAFRSLISVD